MRSILVVMLMTAPAMADSKTPDVHAMHTDDCAKARAAGKTCVINMGTEDLKGDKVTPDGSGIRVVVPTKEPSLIKLRKDFIVEILKSAEDL